MSPFEAIKHDEDGVEYWSARELMVVLDYQTWYKFKPVLERAREACENSGYAASDHMLQTEHMVTIGSGATRKVQDYQLSRYACYLIVQNADPDKPIVALGQTYFASQTRAAELSQDQERIYLRDQVAEHNKTLFASVYEVGVVTSHDFSVFNDHGYRGLYKGERAKDIAARKGLAKGERILDWLGTEELADNLFRQVQAEARIRRQGAASKDEANHIHHHVGQQVRRFIIEELEGTPPEQLQRQPKVSSKCERASSDGWRLSSSQPSGVKSNSPATPGEQ